MGVSTDAKLGWGVAWAEHWQAHYDDEDEADETRIAEATLEAFGVRLVEHCSKEHSMPALFITESVVIAWRGHVKEVATPEPPPEWAERIDRATAALAGALPSFAAFLKEYGAPAKGWRMVSWWC